MLFEPSFLNTAVTGIGCSSGNTSTDLLFLSDLHWDGDALMHRWCPRHVWASEVGLWCAFRRVLQDVGSEASPLLDSFYVWRKKHQFTQQHHLQVSLVSADSVESSNSLGCQCRESAPSSKRGLSPAVQLNKWWTCFVLLLRVKWSVCSGQRSQLFCYCLCDSKRRIWAGILPSIIFFPCGFLLVAKIQVSHAGKFLLLWTQSTVAYT